jgi:hypothetical protein
VRFYNPFIARALAVYTGFIAAVETPGRTISLFAAYVLAGRADGCPGSDLKALASALYEAGAPDALALWVEAQAISQDFDRISATRQGMTLDDRTVFRLACVRWEVADEENRAMTCALARLDGRAA